MAAKQRYRTLEVAGREVRLSNPDKVFFPEAGHTKLDLASYYLEAAEAAVIHLRERPTTLKRFVEGARASPSSRSAFRTALPAGSRPRRCTSRAGAAGGSSWRTTPRTSCGRSTWA